MRLSQAANAQRKNEAKKKMPEKLIKLIQDPVLICITVVIVLLVATICGVAVKSGHNLTWVDELIIVGVPGIILLVGIFIRYHWMEKQEAREKDFEGKLKTASCELAGLRDENDELRNRLDNPSVSIVSKRDYGQLIQKWNDSGEGYVLLYNIELQSFQTDDDIRRTWGKIGELSNIKKVVLLLPESKIQRWENVVRIQENKFFASPENRKFLVCEFNSEEVHTDITDSPSIGFAMYRRGDDVSSGPLHDDALVFVMSGPFSKFREATIPEDSDWWDYHHIIKFYTDQGVVSNLDQTWRQCYDKDRARDVDRVVKDVRTARPHPS